MSLVSLLQKQVEHRALLVCQQRNQGLPAELGKANFESIPNGVVFSKQHFLLDSSHCDYMNEVAKVVWSDSAEIWQLFMVGDEANMQWLPYPYLAQSLDLTAIMREIAKDPKDLFWQ